MVSATVVEREGAKIWIEQVEVLRQKNSGTLVFLCEVSEKRFGFKAEVREGQVLIRVGDERDQDCQAEVTITASGDDLPLFSRPWWYFTRSTGLGTVVLLDKHHWLQIGVSEILYTRDKEKRRVG